MAVYSSATKYVGFCTAENLNFSVKDFFSKCEWIRIFLRITYTKYFLNGRLYLLCSFVCIFSYLLYLVNNLT